jgi:hypothetical protein
MLSWISERVHQMVKREEREDHADLVRVMTSTLNSDVTSAQVQNSNIFEGSKAICEASFQYDLRGEIIMQLSCGLIPDIRSGDWRTIYNALRILNLLMDSGCLEMFREVQEGKHVDLTQRLLFLSEYNDSDPRKTKLIRSTARETRARLLLKFEEIDQNNLSCQPEKITKSSVSSGDHHVTSGCSSRIPESVSNLVSLRHVESDSSMDGSHDEIAAADFCESREITGSNRRFSETPVLPDLL